MRTCDREEAPGDVVVVDDTPANLQLLVGILAARGYRVRPVTGGAAALRTIRARVPDLVLLDIDMPGMDGIEVCRRIKAGETSRDVPIIFISIISGGTEKTNAFASGGVDYITKPFDPDEVLARVGTHIALGRHRRRLAETVGRLRALEAMRETLAHMIAHDMRSPLLTVGLALETLAPLVPAGDSSRARVAQHGRACVESLLGLVTRMLEVSRLEEAGMPLSRADHDLGALAREVVDRFQVRAGGRTLGVRAEAAVVASVDRGIVARVVENLVDNAIKFTGEAGCIDVIVSRADASARIAVRDDGAGIAPALQARLFTKFVQGEAAEAARGFGLGLAFVRLAVESHGGRVGVKSEPGVGSEFWVEFPVVGEASTGRARAD